MLRVWIENDRKEKEEITNSPYYESIIIEGLLPSKTIINSTIVANKDGAIYNSSRVDIRNIEITIKPSFPVEENRQRLYRYFPQKKEITLYFKNENRDLMIEGRVEDFDGSLFDMKQTISINIQCLSPYFKDRKNSYTEMSVVYDMFEFPFSIEEGGIEFSRIEKSLTQNIYNAGDIQTGLIIEIYASGEVVNPIIYNADTREYFGLNITMQYGDLIRINTNQFNKYVELVRYGQTRNIINNILKGNKWFMLIPGDNLFTYKCDVGEEFVNFKFIYSNCYGGV